MFIRSYAAEYPDEVVGIVFVDPATEDIYENMRAQAPERWDTFIEEVNPSSSGWGPQWDALPESLEQTKFAWPLPQVPMVVLTGLTLLPGEWALETAEYMEFWQASHERLVDRLGHADHIILEDEDHLTILTDPALRDAILGIVRGLRARSALTALRPRPVLLRGVEGAGARLTQNPTH